MLWACLVLRESMFTSALGMIHIMQQREYFLVFWVRLALKREFTGARGTICIILGAKNGVFTSGLRARIGLEI